MRDVTNSRNPISTFNTIRGIYSSSMFMSPTEDQIDNELNNIRAAGFNTVFLGISNNGNGVCWPNPRLQFNVLETVRDPSTTFTTDYVEYYINAANAKGLQVAFWIQCQSGGSVRQDLRDANTGTGFYNPHLPATAQYFADIIQEGLTRYPSVVGVEIAEYTNFQPWGNGEATGAHITNYLVTTGRDYVTDYTQWNTGGWSAPADTAFQAWMTNAHVQFLTTLRTTMQGIDRIQGKNRFFGLYSSGNEVLGAVAGELGQTFTNMGLLDYLNCPRYDEDLANNSAQMLRIQRNYGRLVDSNSQLMPQVPQSNIVISMQLYNNAVTASLTPAQIISNMEVVYQFGPKSGTIHYHYAGHYNADFSEDVGGPWLNAAQRAAFRGYFEVVDNRTQ